MSHTLVALLLFGSLLVLAAVVSVRLASRTGLPSLLLFLGLGLLFGEEGFGIEFEDFDLARDLSFVALAVIIGEGGMTTNWKRTRPIIGLASTLATVGIDADIQQTILTGNAFAEIHVKLRLAERRRHLILYHFNAHAITDRLIAHFDRLNAADVQPQRRIKLQRQTAGRCFWVAEHNTQLLSQLIDEDQTGF